MKETIKNILYNIFIIYLHILNVYVFVFIFMCFFFLFIFLICMHDIFISLMFV